MKKISTLIFLLVAAFLVTAQSYRPFPASGHFWIEEHALLVPGSCGYEYHTCQTPVYFGIDSVINGLTYHRLIHRWVCSWQYAGPPPIPLPPCQNSGSYSMAESDFIFFRQDTIARRVYMYYPQINGDTLLYDFNLNAGDVVPQSYINPDYPAVNVVRVDTLNLADGMHRRLVMNVSYFGGDSVALIEGIGSTFGLSAPLVSPFENSDRLLCFSDLSQTIYPNATTSCVLSLGIPDPLKQLSASVYPNPFNNYFELQLASGFKADIQILQMDGRLVKEFTMEKDHMRVGMDDLNSGLYIIRIESQKEVIIKKILRL
jgi:hypothetical protein